MRTKNRNANSLRQHGLRKIALSTGLLLILGILQFESGSAAFADIIMELRPESTEPSPSTQATVSRKPSQFSLTVNLGFDKLGPVVNQFQFKIQPGGALDGVLTIDKIEIAESGKPQYPLEIKAPFSYTGKINGTPYKDETGTATIDWAIRVGNDKTPPDWCPIVEFDAPYVELQNPGFFWYKDYIAKDYLNNELSKLLSCDNLKNDLSQAWRTLSFPIAVGTGIFYLNASPSSIAISDAVVEDSHIRLQLLVDATATLTRKAPTSSVSLPAPGRLQGSPKTGGGDAESSISAYVYPDFK